MDKTEKRIEQFDNAFPAELRKASIANGFMGGEFCFDKINFLENTARFINWELGLQRNFRNDRRDFTIKTIFYKENGDVVSEFSNVFYFNAEWISP